jgi:hypothetical protein
MESTIAKKGYENIESALVGINSMCLCTLEKINLSKSLNKELDSLQQEISQFLRLEILTDDSNIIYEALVFVSKVSKLFKKILRTHKCEGALLEKHLYAIDFIELYFVELYFADSSQ